MLLILFLLSTVFATAAEAVSGPEAVDTVTLREQTRLENTQSMSHNYFVPFLEWLESDVVGDEKTTKYLKIAGFVGAGVGLIAAYPSFPLAGNFSILLSQYLGLPPTDVVYFMFGINSVIPSMALNSIATQHEFKVLVSPAGPADRLFKKKTVLHAIDFIAHALSFFAALSSGYVGYLVSESFSLPLNILFTGCAYGGCYTFTAESQKRIARSIFYFISQDKEKQFKKKALKDALILSAKQIAILPDEDIDDTYGRLFLSNSERHHHEAHSEKLKILLSIGNEMPALALRSQANVFGEKVIQVLGTFIGMAETYVAFSLVNAVVVLILSNVIGVRNPSTTKTIGYTVSTLGCIPWASLDVEGVTGRFSRIYHELFNKNEHYQDEFVSPITRKIIFWLSIWGGISSAIPPTYLAIMMTEGLPIEMRVLITVATFLCPMTVLTEALDTMLCRGWDKIKTFKQDSMERRKERIILSLSSILNKIEELPISVIDPLFDVFIAERNTVLPRAMRARTPQMQEEDSRIIDDFEELRLEYVNQGPAVEHKSCSST